MVLFSALALASLLSPSFEAMGGRAQLEHITSVEYTAVGERDMVEQSERPSGPWFFDHFRLHEVRDLARRRTRLEQTDEAYAADAWWLDQPVQTPHTTIINDDVAERITEKGPRFAGGYLIEENDDQYAFAPERLLLTAEAAPDLHGIGDVILHGVRHHRYAFSFRGDPCVLTVNADTHLPWSVTFTHPYRYQTFLSAWGDVTTTITYNGWNLEDGGIIYPREWSFERVGLPDTRLSIVSLHFNRPLDDAAMTVDPAIFAAHHQKLVPVDSILLGYGGDGTPVTIAPGIVQYPGAWNVEFVKQDDGIVVIEAPWSPHYAKQAFAAAQRLLGGRIKAVVTTSDSWPHIAGVREAVAEGIPVYALDLNEPILRRLLDAPHRMHADDLARNPRPPSFHFVTRKTTIGSGRNAIELIPYRTATAERQMMVYFPGPNVAYTSDLFAPDNGNGWFTPEYVHEFETAIGREGIRPERVFGMHYGPTPLTTVLQKSEGGMAPSSSSSARLSSSPPPNPVSLPSAPMTR